MIDGKESIVSIKELGEEIDELEIGESDFDNFLGALDEVGEPGTFNPDEFQPDIFQLLVLLPVPVAVVGDGQEVLPPKNPLTILRPCREFVGLISLDVTGRQADVSDTCLV